MPSVSRVRAVWIFGVCAGLLCAAETFAGSLANPSSLAEREFLTGDWNGTRNQLSRRGIELTVFYTGEVMGNVAGGKRRGAVYDGLLDAGLDLDLEKLAGWSGAKMHVNGYETHGTSLSSKFAGDLGDTSNIEFSDGLRLFEFWLEQSFFEDRFSLRIGQLAADAEFWVSDYALLFLNAGFGVPTAISGNLPVPIYAIAGLGVRLKFEPRKGLYAQFGAFDGNPAPAVFSDPSPGAAASTDFNRHGTHAALRGDEGALLLAEIGWRFHQPPEPETEGEDRLHPLDRPPSEGKPSRKLAGSYKVGVAFHTDTFSNIRDVTLAERGSARAPARARSLEGNCAAYFVAEQELWRERGSDSQGIGVFLRGTFAPPDRNFFDYSLETGANWIGAIPHRGDDELGLAFARYNVSDEVADAFRETREAAPDAETVIELTYKIHATPWLSLQPDAQYIFQPGGSSAVPNALVFGLRLSVKF